MHAWTFRSLVRPSNDLAKTSVTMYIMNELFQTIPVVPGIPPTTTLRCAPCGQWS